MSTPTKMAGRASKDQWVRAGRAALRAGALLLAAALPACSYGIPSLMPETDDIATGSIGPRVPVLDPDLDAEDLRRARGALAIALDPQGNGRTVKWDNPDTGRSGAITADGSPFVESDLVCRRFSASVTHRSGPDRALRGKACKPTADEWELREVKAVHKPA